MHRTVRIILYTLAILVIVVLIAAAIGSVVVHNKIENTLQNELPPHLDLNYEELDVHTLSGSLTIKALTLNLRDKENEAHAMALTLDALKIQNLSYWEYLFHDQIAIKTVIFDNPDIKIYEKTAENNEVTENSTRLDAPEIPVFIDRFEINNATISSHQAEDETIGFYAANLFLSLAEVSYSNLKDPVFPIVYKEINASGDSIFFDTGPYENLTVKSFHINDNLVSFKDIHFFTKYPIADFNALLPYERDHYNIKIPELQIQNYDYEFKKDSLTAVAASKIQINQPEVAIYRDKTIADDTTFKPLYNRSLRTLDFDLSVDSLEITNAQIGYTERHQKENRGGKLTFSDLNAKIAQVGNTYKNPVVAEIHTVFMNNARVAATWELDVHSPMDQFLFKAEVSAFDAGRINDFVRPNLNAEIEGTAHKTYFTIDGNNENSTTDLRIKYSDLKVNILNKDKKKKRKLISAAANIVIPKDSKNHGESFNESTGKTPRNKTQSVFNQLWISLESALKEAILPGLLKNL